jgi:DNA-binding NarL/FixJ family response regulator
VSAAISLLRSELERFADRYELTAREYDVVFLLLSGLSTVSLIAERLGLSQNTVHNHFKNVFRRTGTNSKAGLLALFLKDAIGHQASLQPFIKRPSILLLEPDARVRANIRDALQARNMRVEEEADSQNVLERIAKLRTDVVIADLALPGQSGEGILADVTARYGQNPLVLLTTSDSSASRRQWVERGAGGLFVKPVAVDRLVFAILEHFVETPYERSRLLRVDVDLPARIDDRLEVELGNIGFGGAFIPLPTDHMSRESFLVGQRIQVTFSLEDASSIQTLCEIMWRRATSRPSMQSGIGVRFLNLDEAHRSTVEEFVRRRKLLGFLPWAGPDEGVRDLKHAQA